MKTSHTSQRILSLDILRGITIAGMIMVNNPGTWSHIYAPLRHAEWNGLTPTDLVFPFFMFIMGISTYISLKKYDFQFSRAAGMKILRRTLVIFLIGIASDGSLNSATIGRRRRTGSASAKSFGTRYGLSTAYAYPVSCNVWRFATEPLQSSR